MAMCGLNVCFTNIRSEMRSILIQKSLQMGADVHTHMSTEVTHLVVGETQSRKYIVGTDLNSIYRLISVILKTFHSNPISSM